MNLPIFLCCPVVARAALIIALIARLVRGRSIGDGRDQSAPTGLKQYFWPNARCGERFVQRNLPLPRSLLRLLPPVEYQRRMLRDEMASALPSLLECPRERLPARPALANRDHTWSGAQNAADWRLEPTFLPPGYRNRRRRSGVPVPVLHRQSPYPARPPRIIQSRPGYRHPRQRPLHPLRLRYSGTTSGYLAPVGFLQYLRVNSHLPAAGVPVHPDHYCRIPGDHPCHHMFVTSCVP